jgi:hypothetical protein
MFHNNGRKGMPGTNNFLTLTITRTLARLNAERLLQYITTVVNTCKIRFLLFILLIIKQEFKSGQVGRASTKKLARNCCQVK